MWFIDIVEGMFITVAGYVLIWALLKALDK